MLCCSNLFAAVVLNDDSSIPAGLAVPTGLSGQDLWTRIGSNQAGREEIVHNIDTDQAAGTFQVTVWTILTSLTNTGMIAGVHHGPVWVEAVVGPG